MTPSSAPVARRLGELLQGFAPVAVDREIRGLALDSRRVSRGDLFFACAGTRVSGVRFIDQAVAAGAAAVAYDAADAEAAGLGEARGGVPLIAIRRLAERVGPIASRFHGEPSRRLKVIGVTGTNGKTSCSHYLAQALGAPGRPCGVIGTLGYGPWGGVLRPATHTTPDAITLQQELARMCDEGLEHVAMEVSSHALAQGRTEGVAFTAAVFTNLSHDHLDYHGDLASYGEAKKRLFATPGLRFAVINRADDFGRQLIGEIGPQVTCAAFGLGIEPGPGEQFVSGEIIRASLDGIDLRVRSSWGEGTLRSALMGAFNAENLLAVMAVLLLLGRPFAEVLERAAALRAVPGRMERFGGADGRPLAIVDYAHTPDALEQVLRTLRRHVEGRLWCVFGCGGDRDRAKRPLMAVAAARHADRIIVTDDNPRGEDPGAIIADVLAGMPPGVVAEVVADRAAAIRAAILGAAEGDIVLVAGKGHEDYQQVGDQRRPFSDRRVVEAALGERT